MCSLTSTETMSLKTSNNTEDTENGIIPGMDWLTLELRKKSDHSVEIPKYQ